MTDLSVIIPTYNRAAFLAPCVASVRAGGVPAEIIIVDDGSTDDTPQRVKELGDDVIYVRQPNAGPASARNTGFAKSTGKYLAFLDSDDSWRPGVVGKLVETLERHPEIDVAYADSLVGNPTDGWQPSLLALLGRDVFDALPCTRPAPGFRILDRGAFFLRMVRKNQVFLGSTVMRRTAFEALGGFDPQLFGGEDYELVLRLAHRGPCGFLDEPLACYLKHAGSISTDTDRMDREYALVMQKVIEKSPGLGAEEREALRRRRRTILFYLGYNSYGRGDLALARQRFRDLRREFGADAKTLALSAACRLPAGLLRGLRRLKRSLAGTAI